MTKIILAFISLLGLGIVASAQPARTKPGPKPTVTTQGGKADDGKRVILKSDGTWVYDTTASTAVPVTTAASRAVDFQAALIFKSGEVVPVPRGTFYLMKKSLADLIATPDQQRSLAAELRTGTSGEYMAAPVEKGGVRDMVGYATKYAMLAPKYFESVQPILKDAVAYQTETDFQGNGSFKNIPPGEYYLFGWTDIRKNFIAWNVKVVVDTSDVKIILDTNNRL